MMYVGVDMIVCSKECHSLVHLKRQKARVFVYIEDAPSIPPFAYRSILAETSYKQKKMA